MVLNWWCNLVPSVRINLIMTLLIIIGVYMSDIVIKPVVRISDQVRNKPSCTATGQNFGFTNNKVEGLYYPCSKNKAVVRVGSPFCVLAFTLKTLFHEMAHKMLVCVL